MQGESQGKEKLVFIGRSRAAAYLLEAKIVQGESHGKEKLVFIGLGRAAAYLLEAKIVQGWFSL